VTDVKPDEWAATRVVMETAFGPGRKRSLLEDLAALEHHQWWMWADDLLRSGEPISEARRARWQGFFVPYEQLPEDIKDRDRSWAQAVLAILQSHFSRMIKPPRDAL
jgi:hypothetical protein